MYRYFLALRYLLSRPINGLGMFAFMLGVWALIVVVSIFSGFIRELKVHIRSATSDVTAFYLGEQASYKRLESTILRNPNVAACAPRLVYAGLLHPDPERAASEAANEDPTANHHLVTLIGIDPQKEARVTGFNKWLQEVSGTPLAVDPAAAGLDGAGSWILLSQLRAQREGAAKDDRLQITTANLTDQRRAGGPAALDLIEHEFQVAGAYATQHSGFDEFNVFVHIDLLRQLLGKPADFVSEIMIRLKDPAQRQATADDLASAIGNMREYVRNFAPPRVVPWEERDKRYLENIEHQRALLKLVLFVIMVVSTFLVYATLSMMVTEKTRDIGILTAMGGTRTGVMQVFLTCGFAIGLIGTFLGVVIGCITSMNLDGIRHFVLNWFGIDLFPITSYNLPRVPYQLDASWIVLVAAIALALGLLVAGLPALRAARHDPLRSLRN
ncbi:MAG: ABC transporter permease, partial [Planctomycetota bacterium]